MNPKDADAIVKLADGFPAAIRDGSYKEKGWGTSMYGISKLSETSYTLWLARHLEPKVRSRVFMTTEIMDGVLTDVSCQLRPIDCTL